jgi:type I restriction enzyme R subunit
MDSENRRAQVLDKHDEVEGMLGDEALREIARELVETVRENVRANLRVLIKRVLTRRGYPPDKQPRAVDLVLEQAAELSKAWAA